MFRTRIIAVGLAIATVGALSVAQGLPTPGVRPPDVASPLDTRCDTHTCTMVRLDDDAGQYNVIDTRAADGDAASRLYWGREEVLTRAADGRLDGDLHVTGVLRAGNSVIISGTGSVDTIAATTDLLGLGGDPTFSNIKVGVGLVPSSSDFTLTVKDHLRLVPSAAPGSPQNGVVYYDSAANKFRCYEAGAWANCVGASSGSSPWLKTGANVHLATIADHVGIGTATPPSKLSVHKDVTATGEATALVTFKNAGSSIGVTGAQVKSTRLDAKGSQIGVRAETSISPTGHSQDGYAEGRLAQVSGFNAVGSMIGAKGNVSVRSLYNLGTANVGLGLGGHFVADVNTPTGAWPTGTFWIGGAYGEIKGTKDSATPAGALAGIIGRDKTTGSATSWAGYFEGKGYFSDLVGVGTNAPDSLLTVASTGYLQFKHAQGGAPPAADCSDDAERGRLSIDTTNNRLYVCNGATRAWDWIALNQ